jgi:hypothetical protein
MIIEQRKHSRFLPVDNAFAALGRSFAKVGKIKDISLGGLSIEYIAGEGDKHDDSLVDIFLTGDLFHLYSIPCRVVSDIDLHIPHVNDMYLTLLTTKRCGIQFRELSKDDEYQLKLFIDTHTTRAARSWVPGLT